jgi:hypothetical protein
VAETRHFGDLNIDKYDNERRTGRSGHAPTYQAMGNVVAPFDSVFSKVST